MLPVNAAIRDLIVQHAPADTIKRKAVELGMRTLQRDGLDKIARGITTPGEVLQVSQDEA